MPGTVRATMVREENPLTFATLLAQQLQNLLPKIVNQVTASVNANANNGNGNGSNGGNGGNGNNGCTYKSFMSCNPKEYMGSVVCRQFQSGEKSFDLVNTSSPSQEGRESSNAMSGMIVRSFLEEEFCPSNEMERLENDQIGILHLVITSSARIKRYMADMRPENSEECSRQLNSYYTKDVKKAKGGTNFVAAAPSREGKSDITTCVLKAALRWRRNERGGGNQVRGRAYNASMNAAEAAKDSRIVMGTFSLNDHFATVLFDSGADFSFISTKFEPILNMKPSISNPGYVIEIVVEIPLVDVKILRVHGERVEESTKALKNAKVDEPKISEVSGGIQLRVHEDDIPKMAF
ncbi:reverse transcriptase domain-containing protein [Tanacetum coccineum]